MNQTHSLLFTSSSLIDVSDLLNVNSVLSWLHQLLATPLLKFSLCTA